MQAGDNVTFVIFLRASWFRDSWDWVSRKGWYESQVFCGRFLSSPTSDKESTPVLFTEQEKEQLGSVRCSG